MANVLVLDDSEQLWRICPEELSCGVVAKNDDEMNELFQDNEAKADWQLLGMIDEVEKHFGTLETGKCYGMTIPAVLGGKYEVSNMNIVSIKDYLGLAGDMAMKIKDLPDGKKIVLKVKGG